MEVRASDPPPAPTAPAPRMMVLFGTPLGAVAGINFAQLLWRFLGWAVGSTAGRIAWGNVGEIGGQLTGALAGLVVWTAWLLSERRKKKDSKAIPPDPSEGGPPGRA